MTNKRTKEASRNGVSFWLDDLDRTRLTSGSLQELIDEDSIVGVTTNPSIFQKALSQVGPYDEQLRKLGRVDAETAIQELTTTDVRNAADIFSSVARKTDFVNGRVSIEVDPRLAHKTEETIRQAKELWKKVDRANIMIKIPATKEGLPAITAVLAEGISVNVTLIFSIERYAEVIDAYLDGMMQSLRRGNNVNHQASVASFFVSRVDTAVDPRLEEIGTPEALSLRGKAAVANARLAYKMFDEKFAHDPRWITLRSESVHIQRPLWASTGTKNPAYSDCKYVEELIAPHVVNTMPEKTLLAFADHGKTEPSILPYYDESEDVIRRLSACGINMAEVTQELEDKGISAFISSWETVISDIQKGIERVNA